MQLQKTIHYSFKTKNFNFLQWLNPNSVYYQYFSGETYFNSNPPCVPTELVEFRKRIGIDGVELIFKESIKVNGGDDNDANLSGDTTIQEKT